jgi:hypothetical protein
MGFAVRSSRGAKLLLGGLLLGSIGLKVSDALPADGAQPNAVVRVQLHNFLVRHGFAEQPTEISKPVTVSGLSGSCRLVIINAAPQGWHQDMPGRFAMETDQVFFIFRSERYQHQPVWFTRADFYLRLPAAYVGFHVPIHLVLGVVASADCDVGKLHWEELTSLSSISGGGSIEFIPIKPRLLWERWFSPLAGNCAVPI